jgi:carbon-monoxide dehydrogenase medium subunit
MQYYEPNFIDEALVLLDRFGSGARLLAGGTRVGFAVRNHPDQITALINLKRIRELSEIEESDGMLRIGALATARAIAAHPSVLRHAPALAAAADSLGAPQLRSVATLGGNVFSGDPASDLCVALLAYDARCELASHDGDARSVPIEQLLGELPYDRPARPLLVSVALPLAPHSSSYEKMTTRHGFEMALVAVAFRARTVGGVLADVRLALAGAAPTVVRAPSAEQSLSGKPFTSALAREAARTAAERDARPHSDARASEAYRRQLVATLAERAMVRALAGAPGIVQ